jgi:hypothetical protein
VSIPLDILAATLGMRLTPDELEWLSVVLKERAEQRRREAGSEPPVLAGYRDAWEPVRRAATSGQAERGVLEVTPPLGLHISRLRNSKRRGQGTRAGRGILSGAPSFSCPHHSR